MTKCKHCKAFFARYSCAKTKPGYDGECDCPKCQGYCECDKYEYTPGKTWPTDNAAHAFGDVWAKTEGQYECANCGADDHPSSECPFGGHG